MSTIDLKSGVKTLNAGSPQFTSNTTTNGIAIDTLKYGHVAFGTCEDPVSNSNGTVTIVIQESDDENFSTFDEIPASQLDTGTYDTLTVVGNTHPAPIVEGISYKKVVILCYKKRYLRAVATSTGVSGGGVNVSISAFLESLCQPDVMGQPVNFTYV